MKKIVFLITLSLVGCVSNEQTSVAVPVKEKPQSAPPERVFQSPAEAIEYAQVNLRSLLKDPNSAEFRGLQAYTRDIAGVYVVCGQVNSKNSFGGYTGFQHFTYSVSYAASATNPVIVNSNTPTMAADIAVKACRNW